MVKMNRRNFIRTGLATAGSLILPRRARAEIKQDNTLINPFVRPDINRDTLLGDVDWNLLTDEQTKSELMTDALILGGVAKITYNNPKFVCHHYSTLDVLKIHGYKKENPEDPDIPQIFFDKGLTQEGIGEFNLPLYYVYVSSPELQSTDFGAHTLVGSVVGNENNGDPRIWDNWRLWEPQNNSIVNIGYKLLPKNSEVSIIGIKKFVINSTFFRGHYLLDFKITNGISQLIKDSVNPNLILQRPPIDPTNVAEQTPTQFNLKQNYPNPFNARTTISYSLENTENVELKIFGANGQHIDTLVNNEYQSRGLHSKIWTPSKSLSSGIYFYRLKTGNHTESKKMSLVK